MLAETYLQRPFLLIPLCPLRPSFPLLTSFFTHPVSNIKSKVAKMRSLLWTELSHWKLPRLDLAVHTVNCTASAVHTVNCATSAVHTVNCTASAVHTVNCTASVVHDNNHLKVHLGMYRGMYTPLVESIVLLLVMLINLCHVACNILI